MKRISILFAAILLATTFRAAADTQVTIDCGGSAVLTATPKTGYHFVNWNNDPTLTANPYTLTDVHGNATYKAYFAINQYTIRFLNDDNSELDVQTVDYGVKPTYTKPTPTKSADAEWTYTFDGWSPTLYEADKDQDYVAQYTKTKNKYTITFVNWDYDGTNALQSSDVEYGTKPVYYGAEPTKPADAENTYTFTGWEDSEHNFYAKGTDLPPVAGAVTYTAVFSNSKNSYNVTVAVKNNEGGTVGGGGLFLFGTEIQITATAADCYKFKQWNDGNTDASRTITVAGETTYTAEFEKLTYTITVESNNTTQGDVKVEKQ